MLRKDTEDSCSELKAQRSLKKQRNYKSVLGTLAAQILGIPSPPAIAGSQMPPTTGRPELHRQQALRRAAVDTRHLGRDEANAEDPSAGDAPQAPVTLDADSPLLTDAAMEQPSLQLHSPTFRTNRSYLSILRT